jgi:16S rRNA (cytidine1402-2'-O)-methyltransferase
VEYIQSANFMRDPEKISAQPAGRLSIVATPIGNLEDFTFRALRTLKEADVILAEDTRRTGQLCRHYGITTRMRPFHAHSNPREVQRCVQELLRGGHLALVSDAGTPLISDPGAELVVEAAKRAIAVETIPGPSAVTAALTASAISFEQFYFLGFLPRTGRRRQAVLEDIAQAQKTVVFFESPNRVGRTLAELAGLLDVRRAVAVCRELTKIHEQVVQGSAAELAERFRDGTLGEVSIVIGGREPESEKPSEADIDGRISELLDRRMTARDVARALSQETGLSRSAIYRRVIALAKSGHNA